MQPVGSIVARRQLGRELRTLREKYGRTREDVAGMGIASLAKLARIEQGLTSIRPGDTRELCVLYGADEETTERLVEIARGTRAPEWWESSATKAPRWFGMYLSLESAASRLQIFQPLLIEGLFQTRDFAMAVEMFMPTSKVLAEKHVAARMERQHQVFARESPLQIDLVLAQEALTIRFTDDKVAAEQLERLAELNRREEITISVLPTGSFPRSLGLFYVMDFPNPDDPSVIYIETYEAARYPESPEQVARFRTLFDKAKSLSVPFEEFTA
jgi:transcriptional regulator with XRE-family HTH domain